MQLLCKFLLYILLTDSMQHSTCHLRTFHTVQNLLMVIYGTTTHQQMGISRGSILRKVQQQSCDLQRRNGSGRWWNRFFPQRKSGADAGPKLCSTPKRIETRSITSLVSKKNRLQRVAQPRSNFFAVCESSDAVVEDRSGHWDGWISWIQASFLVTFGV